MVLKLPEKDEIVDKEPQSAQADEVAAGVETNEDELRLSFHPGQTIGQDYILISIIGLGGMGAVYKARHKKLGEVYALKILQPNQINEQNWQRFVLEARVLARLQNPHIVKIINMGVHEEICPYYVMELLPGRALSEMLEERGPLDLSTAIKIFIDVCSALASAHKRGIIHRDIKPANIMIKDQPSEPRIQVTLVDFGIVRLTGKSSGLEQAQTVSGEIFGSPPYISPEQCLGYPADERSDIYSLGCALFQALTGRTPFESEAPYQIMYMHIDQEPPTLAVANPELKFDPSIELMIAKLLKKDPNQRYQTVQQVAHDLSRIQAGKPIDIEGKMAALPPLKQSTINDLTAYDQGSKHAFFIFSLMLCLALTTIACSMFIQMLEGADKNKSALLSHSDHAYDSRAVYPAAAPAEKGAISSIIILPDGTRKRRFNFTKDSAIGSYRGNDGLLHKAEGIIDAPIDRPLSFYFSSLIDHVASVLRRFGPDDLCEVRISTDDLPEAVKTMAGWHKLRVLGLKRCLVNDLQVSDLDKLQGLRGLELDKSEFDLSALGRLQNFAKLESFSLIRMGKLSSFLPILRSDHALKTLTIKDSALTEADFKAIAQIKSLERLTIYHDTKTDTWLGAAYISKMPALKKLTVLADDWWPRDLELLKRSIPEVKVTDSEAIEEVY